MIEIIENKDNIIIKGHAGYDVKGKDIVCSSISTLALTLIESLKRLAWYTEEPKIEEGYIEIKNKAISRNSEILIEAFFIGVIEVATLYPAYIKVSRRATQ